MITSHFSVPLWYVDVMLKVKASYHSVFYRPDALPATQPTVAKALKA